MALTDHDKYVIARARQLAGLVGIDAMRNHYDETDNTATFVQFTGEAKYLLGELAAITDRLGGGNA